MSLESFKNKLDNYNGIYKLNFAIEEEREYYLESVGGEDNLRDNFPILYDAYRKSLRIAENCMQANLDPSEKVEVKFSGYDIHPVDLETNAAEADALGRDTSDYARLHLSFVGNFLDSSKSLTDLAPADTFEVSIYGKVFDPGSPRMPFIRVNGEYENVNQIDFSCVSAEPYHKEELNNRKFQIRVDLDVYDSDRVLHHFCYNTVMNPGNIVDYVFDNIHIDAPVSSHPETNEIRILYARTASNLEKPDYIYSSNDASKNNGKLWTIIPIKGYATMKNIYSSDNYYSFVKLHKPGEGENLTRSVLDYEHKDWRVFRNDLKDDDLYKLLTDSKNGIFAVTRDEKNIETLYFDLFNPDWNKDSDRHYDWKHDIDKAPTDGNDRIANLIAGFEYDICTMDKNGKPVAKTDTTCQVEFHSVDPDFLAKNHRSYYTFMPGSYTIYIPPIRLWWGCYSGETSIMLSDGSYKRADQIEIGDALTCYGNKNLIVDNIYYGEKEKEIICIQTERGDMIKVSVGHPMLMEDGAGMTAESIKPGDKVMMADNTAVSVTSVAREPYGDTVYNFTFEGEEDGNYLIANKFYSGDFYAQNKFKRKPAALTKERKELHDELKRLQEYLNK